MIRYLFPLILAACTSASPAMDASSSDASDSPSSTDSAGGMCANADAGAACNTVVQGAAATPLVATGMAIPTGTGGTFADGRYFLTKFESYTGVMAGLPMSLTQTVEICGGMGLFVESSPNSKRKNFTFAPSGTQPNFTQTCTTNAMDINVPHASYTATPTSFTLYSTMYSISFTYTKQ